MTTKGAYLGEFEELILIATATLVDEAYGVSIMNFIESEAGRTVNISAVHEVLKRLENKGLLKSRMGGATAERGGRRKRYFKLTAAGTKMLTVNIKTRMNLYLRIPNVSLNSI